MGVLYQFFIFLHEKKVGACTRNWCGHFIGNLHTTLNKWRSSVVVICQGYCDISSPINEELCRPINFSRQMTNRNFMPFFTDFDCEFIKRVISFVKAVKLLRWFRYPKSSAIMKSADGSSELKKIFLLGISTLWIWNLKYSMLFFSFTRLQ